MTGIFALVGALMFASAAWFGYVLAGAIIARGTERFGDAKPLAIVGTGCALGALIGLHESSPLHLLGLSLVVVSLAALVRCDIALHWSPPWLALVPLGAIIGIAIVHHAYTVPIAALLVSLPFASIALMTKGTGMSWSDVRIAALGASLLGFFPAVVAFSSAALVLAFIQRGFRRGAGAPFAPYLVGATAAATLIFGG